MQGHESQAKRCQNHFHQPQFAPLAHFPPAFTLAALTPCWSSVNIGSIPALHGKFLKEESRASQRKTAGPFNASTAKMLLAGKDFGLGWTAGVSTLPNQQPVSGLLFLSKQGSTGQRSRLHGRSNGSSVRCPMTLHHWPFRIHWRPPQVQVAPLATAAKVARRCFSLGAAAGTDGAPRQALAARVGDVFGLVSRHHITSIVVDSRTARKKATRPGFVVAAFCSFCNSPCTAQRFHQVASDHGVDVCGRACLCGALHSRPQTCGEYRCSLGGNSPYASYQRDVPWLSILHSRAGANGCLRSRLQVSEALW